MRHGSRQRAGAWLLGFLFTFFVGAGLGYAAEEDIAKYPSRPINFIIPLSPGDAADMAARFLAKEAEKYLGQPLVPINKAGGGATIGISAIASAKPDGYTLGYPPHSGVFVGPQLSKLSYHPLQDLTPIMQFGVVLFGVSVKANSPYKSFADILAHARKNPKKVTYATIGPTSMQHFVMSQIARKEKLEIVHIPFKGGSEVHAALLGGNVDFVVGTIVNSLVEAGEERVLLILNEERSAAYQKIPSLKELGFEIPIPMMLSIVGPKGMPAPMVRKIEDAFTKATKEPAFIKGMQENLRYPIVHRNSKELGDYLAKNYEAYRRILTEMGLIK